MTIQERIAQLITDSLLLAQQDEELPRVELPVPDVERPQSIEHGDFACALPLRLARTMKMSPLTIAEQVAGRIAPDQTLEKIWTAPPGFVNFSLKGSWLAAQVESIREAGSSYGDSTLGAGQRVQVEFVSVNPTGPLHVGHARGAVFGSALANVLEAAGYLVQREYYVNDAGNQMETFNRSLLARYLQASGRDASLPEDGYRGDYMLDLAEQLRSEVGDRFLSQDSEEAASELGKLGMNKMIDEIRSGMEDLRVIYDDWFSESSLYENGQYDEAMSLLREGGYLTERDGATWFTSEALGDEKDKVFVRTNGSPTYFAADVAYHFNKFSERGFDRVIDVWGADHQGHAPFMRAMATALGIVPDRLVLLLYQLVTLKRGGEVVRASKRSGDIVTLRELVQEVGVDACRFFFLSRSPDSQMEFDIDLAKKQSAENPVYYVQYAHARIAGILRLATEKGIDYEDGDLSLLVHEAELALIRKMLFLPELVEQMAVALEPHHLPHYAVELATEFQRFYEQCRVVSSLPHDAELSKARLLLVDAVRIALARCLDLMSMDAPDEM
jgi:arginyl-tRNA synthetase